MSVALDEAKARGGLLGNAARPECYRCRGWLHSLRLYFLPVQHNDLPEQVSMTPAW